MALTPHAHGSRVVNREAVVRREAVHVLDRVVGALLDEQLAELARGVVRHGEVQRRVAVRVLVVDVRAAVYEQLGHALVRVLARHEQQRVALLVLGVDVEVEVERFLQPLEAVVADLAEDHLRVGRASRCGATRAL